MKVVDMHCDTITLFGKEDSKGDLRNNEYHLDLNKMKEGDYLLQNFAVFTHFKNEANPYEYAKNAISI